MRCCLCRLEQRFGLRSRVAVLSGAPRRIPPTLGVSIEPPFPACGGEGGRGFVFYKRELDAKYISEPLVSTWLKAVDLQHAPWKCLVFPCLSSSSEGLFWFILPPFPQGQWFLWAVTKARSTLQIYVSITASLQGVIMLYRPNPG